MAHVWRERIPIGILYREEGRPTYENQVPALQEGPVALRPFRHWTEEDYGRLESEFV
jgi:hypothetical protein